MKAGEACSQDRSDVLSPLGCERTCRWLGPIAFTPEGFADLVRSGAQRSEVPESVRRTKRRLRLLSPARSDRCFRLTAAFPQVPQRSSCRQRTQPAKC